MSDATGAFSVNERARIAVRTATCPTGARKAVADLFRADPQAGRLKNPSFFRAMAEMLMWPLLYTAGVSDRSMVDVAAWVFTQDCPRGDWAGEVATLLAGELVCDDAVRRSWATEAVNELAMIWGHQERVRGSVYAAAEALVTLHDEAANLIAGLVLDA